LTDKNTREIAFSALVCAADGSQFIEFALDDLLSKQPLSAANRRLCRELTFGCVRWRDTLDWLIARRTHSAPVPELAIILRLGLYQLLWLERIPPHAIVNESVNLARGNGFQRQSGFVNAVLRGYVREREETLRDLEQLKNDDPALGWSHPSWLVDRWSAAFGDSKCRELLQWNNRPATTYARANTLRGTAAELEILWDEEGVRHERFTGNTPNADLFYGIKTPGALPELESFRAGRFYLQDPSTGVAPGLLAVRAGDRVLDFCAAPGGKTTLLAQLMDNQGEIWAQDHPDRLDLVRENCDRLGIKCVTRMISPRDARAQMGDKEFDRVLVDAPCSNTGVLRRRVDLRWRLSENEIRRLTRLQSNILKSAANHVSTGGPLVYSTCSLEPDENSEIVSAFLKEHGEFRLKEETTLFPGEYGIDGAYAAAIERR
jgi:16S rRNA (cytosine967-C5)-methyltransferase